MKRIVLAAVLLLLFVAFFHIFNRNQDEVETPTFPALLSKIEDKKVRHLYIRGTTYSGMYDDTKDRFRAIGPPADWVMQYDTSYRWDPQSGRAEYGASLVVMTRLARHKDWLVAVCIPPMGSTCARTSSTASFPVRTRRRDTSTRCATTRS